MSQHHTYRSRILLLATLLASTPLYGKSEEQVIAHQTRTTIIEQAQAILDDIQTTPQLATADLAFPFHRIEKSEPEPVATTQDNQPDVAPTIQASDSVILRAMAEQFTPTGSLIKADKRLLLLPGGNLISEGQSIPLTVRGQQYQILVEEVQKDGYTLRLNDVILKRKFTNIQSDSIKID